MPVQTRPYFMTYNGINYMVEASNPAAAVRHVVGAVVTDLRPARGSEVVAWTRAGKEIPIAGTKGLIATMAQIVKDGAPAQEIEPEFDVDDARMWLVDHGVTEVGGQTFSEMHREERMTLEQFDLLRVDVPAFGEAIVHAITGSDEGATVITVDEIRAQLEDSPFDWAIVIGAIGEAKRAEMFVAPPAGPDAE